MRDCHSPGRTLYPKHFDGGTRTLLVWQSTKVRVQTFPPGFGSVVMLSCNSRIPLSCCCWECCTKKLQATSGIWRGHGDGQPVSAFRAQSSKQIVFLNRVGCERIF